MARTTKRPEDSETELKELRRLLDEFAIELKRSDLREKVLALVPAFERLRTLGISLMPEMTHAAARDRILAYFRKYPRTVIDGSELMVVAGIGEWARRVRELRVEFGWSINSGTTYKDMADDLRQTDGDTASNQIERELGFDPLSLRPDQYVLISEEQDRDAAFRWRVLNEIRKSRLSVRDKILEYLKLNVGKPVLGEELKYLSKDRTEWARRVRELRTEFGWAVASRMSGRPELPVGVYVLEHDSQSKEHDRKIPDPVRVTVLTRDNHSCRVCGWNYGQQCPGDPRRFLELHHVEQHLAGGANTADNLISLCNVHHDEVHSDETKALNVEALLAQILSEL